MNLAEFLLTAVVAIGLALVLVGFAALAYRIGRTPPGPKKD